MRINDKGPLARAFRFAASVDQFCRTRTDTVMSDVLAYVGVETQTSTPYRSWFIEWMADAALSS